MPKRLFHAAHNVCFSVSPWEQLADQGVWYAATWDEPRQGSIILCQCIYRWQMISMSSISLMQLLKACSQRGLGIGWWYCHQRLCNLPQKSWISRRAAGRLCNYLFLNSFLNVLVRIVFNLFLNNLYWQAPLAQPESPTASAGEDVHSLADSMDSDRDSICSNSNLNGNRNKKEKEKQKKDKEKNRTDSVANKLGSLSKTLGIKLKKNMGGLGGLVHGKISRGSTSNGRNGETVEKLKKKESNKTRKGSKEESSHSASSSPTDKSTASVKSPVEKQSDQWKYSTDVKLSLNILRAAMQGERKFIFAGLLLTSHRHQFHEEMINYYLTTAQERFNAEQEQRRKETERKTCSNSCKNTCNNSSCKKEEQEPSRRSKSEPNSQEDTFQGSSQSHIGHLSSNLQGISDQISMSTSPPNSGTLKAGTLTSAHFTHTPALLQHVIHVSEVRSQPSSYQSDNQSPVISSLKTCATYPQHSRSMSYQNYCPVGLSGLPTVETMEPLKCLLPPEHKSHTYTNGFGSGDVSDYLEYADEAPSFVRQSGEKGKVRGVAGTPYSLQQNRCKQHNCPFYGRPETELYCSYCYKEELKRRDRGNRSVWLWCLYGKFFPAFPYEPTLENYKYFDEQFVKCKSLNHDQESVHYISRILDLWSWIYWNSDESVPLGLEPDPDSSPDSRAIWTLCVTTPWTVTK